MTLDLDLWPTDLNINRGHLLIQDYLPTKFEASGAKGSWVISCTRLRDTDIQTDRPTDMCKAICPSFFKGGHKDQCKNNAKQSIPYSCSMKWIHMDRHMYVVTILYTALNKPILISDLKRFELILSLLKFANWANLLKNSVCPVLNLSSNRRSKWAKANFPLYIILLEMQTED